MAKYTLELTEEQVRALSDAAEIYCRLMIGQTECLEDLIPGGPLAHFLRDKDMGQLTLFRIAANEFKRQVTGFETHQSHGIRNPQVPDKARVLFDLHQVIRHELYKDEGSPAGDMSVWAHPADQTSAEVSLAKIRKTPG